MTEERELPEYIVNMSQAPEQSRLVGEHWGAEFVALTPYMKSKGGSLGVNRMRVPPGRSVCPFHYHVHEDEAFVVLSGQGVLRYGDERTEIGEGDVISCPAGTRVAHQIGNTSDEDLVYLAIGPRHPHEICVYPDNGKVMVRSLQTVGQLSDEDYWAREPDPPLIFSEE